MISFSHSEEYLFSLLRVSLLAFYLSRGELSNIVRGFSLSLSLSLSLSVWLSRGGGGKEERLPEGGCGIFRLGRTFEDDTNAFRFILT